VQDRTKVSVTDW